MKEGTGFSHLSFARKTGGVAKWEKSAMLQERAAKHSWSSSQQEKEDSSCSNSDKHLGKGRKSKEDDNSKKDTKKGEKNSSDKDEEERKGEQGKDEDEAEEDDEDAKENKRQPQLFMPHQLMETNTTLAKIPKSIRDDFS